jgi:hypothetical protein
VFYKVLEEKRKYLKQRDEFNQDKIAQIEYIDKKLEGIRSKPHLLQILSEKFLDVDEVKFTVFMRKFSQVLKTIIYTI